MRRLIFCQLLLLIGLTLTLVAPAQNTESKTNIKPMQENPGKPEKPKTYREKYVEFYNPKDYAKNYKERYKPENYKEYYHDLHRENFQQFKNSRKYLESISKSTDKIIDKATRLDPMAEDIFNVDKYGKTKVDNSRNYIPMPFYNPYEYRDYQYSKRGYGSSLPPKPYTKYDNPDYWVQEPRLATVYGEWQPNALTDFAYSNQRKLNALPHTNEVYLPVPMPGSAPVYGGSYFPQQNPYLKYLVGPGQPQIYSPQTGNGPIAPDDSSQSLPKAQQVKEKPDEITSDSTNTVSPQNNDINQTTNGYSPQPIQRPPETSNPPAPVHLSPAQLLYKQGLQSFAQRNYTKAGQTFQNLVKMNPGAPYVQFGHGLSLFYSGNYNDSLQAFQTSIDLSRQKAMQQPTLWQMYTQPNDFRYHFKKLAKYAEQHPKNESAKELLFLLSKISSKPKTINR